MGGGPIAWSLEFEHEYAAGIRSDILAPPADVGRPDELLTASMNARELACPSSDEGDGRQGERSDERLYGSLHLAR
jgi:hypothetical protein